MILRTCEALGVQEVWLVPPPAGVKYRATMVRSRHASRGAERFLTLHRLASVKEVAERCQAEGRELWVSYCPPRLAGPSPGPEAVPLTAGSVSSPLPRLALVLGTESDGISTTMLRQSNRAVFLPMYGFVQSLNVAVACGMLLQRLFDLCPEARGDLNPIAKDRLANAARALQKQDEGSADDLGLDDIDARDSGAVPER
ncbi:tRNA (guanosine(18)-2'-O)-methyltransferase (tRNA [Gm18] methyltransferase) [Durusdinium trenchii]|uniref:tRNA (Guanosine(18)-2'-O)-methyltransferase (tRNA [Gm18] methyltransferase) n=1 Tax=Durusdinium trenchii TaxID=1381693 RepID=A0ABP0SF18_9DINO